MDAINNGTVKCLVVKDLSRVGRTYIEVGEFLFDTLPARGIRFISINDQYDSFADDASHKKLVILFKNLINHMYSRDLGKKIRSAHDMKKQRGEPAGLAPYGYRKNVDGTHLEIDADAADMVRYIFDMRLSGMSANGIAKHLTAQNIPSPQQYRYNRGETTNEKYSVRQVWSIGTVSKLLHNEVYTGCLLQGKYDCNGKVRKLLPSDKWIRHENAHPAIIDREKFDAVQVLLDEIKAKYKNTEIVKGPENVYRGKVFCSRCGKSAPRGSGGRNAPNGYYHICRYCVNDLKIELGISRAPILTVNMLNTIVSQTLRVQTAVLIDIDKSFKKLVSSNTLKTKNSELIKEHKKYKKALADADRTFSAAYIHYLDGILDKKEFEAIRDKSAIDKETAAAQLAAIEREQSKYSPDKIKNNAWHTEYKKLRKFDNPTKEMVQTLIKRISLTPITNEVHIELNYMDEFSELRELFAESGVLVNV